VAIRRGTIHRVKGFTEALGLLVLTNDDWNDAATGELAGALVYPGSGPERESIPATGLFAGTLLSVPKAVLDVALVQLSAGQLRPVEDMLVDVLALDQLRTKTPQSPPTQPGVIDYPRWSEIYYAGPPVGEPAETKRRVTVSTDSYNRALKGAIFVRTTTSANRGGEGFPELRDGTKAVCLLPTFVPSSQVRLGPRDRRPDPRQFFIADMAAIATGLGDALQL